MQKIKFYSILFALGAGLTGLGLLIFMNVFAPDSPVNVMIFYALSSIFIFFISTLAAFYLRKRFGQSEFLNQYFSVSAREGFWLVCLWVICLILLKHNLFSWLSAGLLILVFTFLEGYLLTRVKISPINNN